MKVVTPFRMALSLSLAAMAFGTESSLPPEAVAILQRFPERKLTLERVVQLALETSDSYSSLRAQGAGREVPLLQAASLLDTSLTLDGNWSDDRRKPASPFMYNQLVSSSLALGTSTVFSSGTRLGLSLSHAYNQMTFPAAAGIGALNYAETRGTLNLTQSLWRNAFGGSVRETRAAAEHQSKATEMALRGLKEDWFLQLTELYYSAWLQQVRRLVAEGTMERRQRLKSIVAVKERRGTAEKPDLLQVSSGLSVSEIDLESAKQGLSDQWRLLLVTLKLPPVFEQVDPILVPIDLDSVPKQLPKACEKGDAPMASSMVEQAKHLSAAAKAQLQSAQSNARPDLDFTAAFGANGLDNTAAASPFSEFARFQFPYYALGLQFRLPLGNYERRAQLLSARIDAMKAEAMASQSTDLQKVQWRNECFTLKRLAHAVDLLEKTARAQKERERLEEERFSLGRSSLLQVIQAGDEASQAELSLKSAMVQHRLAAWKLRRLSGDLADYLKKLDTKGD